MFSSNKSYPGLLRACLLIDGLRLSTLESFYEKNYLTQLMTDLVIDQSKFNIVPLKSSLIENITLPIRELIHDLFVKEWKTSMDYSSYFSICAPLHCEYSYIQRTNTLNIISILFWRLWWIGRYISILCPNCDKNV
ncbi:unnamed protein product [Adineta ricciae]|uniref:Uncharacterized protein n=1 Tax=Adineta ricciae TaxID=249248 RepID=A0A815B2B1_ADIRI|nr:unnamed protein product [Adineta ricciae]